ncbi:LAFA_0E05886g1_1 [Lachancea sp. 'fantastica']|nr:LAFA_0E05886g1_1 [Lachancea sp. 'fantastica']
MAETSNGVSDAQDLNGKIQTTGETNSDRNIEISNRTRLLRDTLELLVDRSDEQRKQCDQLSHENRYLQDYIENLMSQGNVLDK